MFRNPDQRSHIPNCLCPLKYKHQWCFLIKMIIPVVRFCWSIEMIADKTTKYTIRKRHQYCINFLFSRALAYPDWTVHSGWCEHPMKHQKQENTHIKDALWLMWANPTPMPTLKAAHFSLTVLSCKNGHMFQGIDLCKCWILLNIIHV